MISGGKKVGEVTSQEAELVDAVMLSDGLSALVQVRNGNVTEYYTINHGRVDEDAYILCGKKHRLIDSYPRGDCVLTKIPEGRKAILPMVQATPLAEASKIIQRLKDMLAKDTSNVRIIGEGNTYRVRAEGRSYFVSKFDLAYGGTKCFTNRGDFRCNIEFTNMRDDTFRNGLKSLYTMIEEVMHRRISAQDKADR